MRLYEHVRGDTWTRAWIVKAATGALVDLTGASARLQLRSTDGTLAVSASTAPDGGITISGSQITLTIPATTMVLPPGYYFFDIELTQADGKRTTLEQVRMQIKEDYTHD